MEINETWNKLQTAIKQIPQKLSRYKYPILVLGIGIGIMLLPTKTKPDETVPAQQEPVQMPSMEQQLEGLLRQIEGVGEVSVLLTLQEGSSSTYQEDIRTSKAGNDTDVERKTVVISTGSGTDMPVVIKTTYPVYKGAVVVCQGADRPSVKLNIVQAVSSLTGLSSDHITVVKMKSS